MLGRAQTRTLKLAVVKELVKQSDYVAEGECTYGFHVWDARAGLGSLCVCGRSKLSAVNRGFIKLR